MQMKGLYNIRDLLLILLINIIIIIIIIMGTLYISQATHDQSELYQ